MISRDVKRFARCRLTTAIIVGVGMLVSGLLLSSCRSSPPKIQPYNSFITSQKQKQEREPNPPEIRRYPPYIKGDTPPKEVVVAIIDSGVDCTIPSLTCQMWQNPNEIPGNRIDDDRNGYIDDIHGWDFRDNDNSSLIGSRIHSHGTFIAGIISTQAGISQSASVVPVRLMDVRFLDQGNRFQSGDWVRFVKAVDYAVDNGARIINLSIYANRRPPEGLRQALQKAKEHGVIVVGIAGNLSESQVLYPARYSSVLAVSATDQEGLNPALFSSYGPEVVLTAPGQDIVSLVPGGATITSSGTSFAAAYVSGVLARVFSCRPEISANEAVGFLCDTAIDIYKEGYDTRTGYGLVNADGAVRAAMNSSP